MPPVQSAQNTTRRAFLRTVTAAVAATSTTVLPTLAIASGADPLRHASPEMLALMDKWRAAKRAYDEASAYFDAVYKQFRAKRPLVPAVLFATEDDPRLRMPEAGGIANLPEDSTDRYYTSPAIRVLRAKPRMREELVWEPIREGDTTFYLNTRATDGVRECGIYRGLPWPEAQARADEIVAAWDRYESETGAVAAATGYDKTDEVLDPLDDAYVEVVREVIAEPARNVADALLKFEVVRGQQSWLGDFEAGVRERLNTEGLSEDAMALVVVADLLALAQGRVFEVSLGEESKDEASAEPVA